MSNEERTDDRKGSPEASSAISQLSGMMDDYLLLMMFLKQIMGCTLKRMMLMRREKPDEVREGRSGNHRT